MNGHGHEFGHELCLVLVRPDRQTSERIFCKIPDRIRTADRIETDRIWTDRHRTENPDRIATGFGPWIPYSDESSDTDMDIGSDMSSDVDSDTDSDPGKILTSDSDSDTRFLRTSNTDSGTDSEKIMTSDTDSDTDKLRTRVSAHLCSVARQTLLQVAQDDSSQLL